MVTRSVRRKIKRDMLPFADGSVDGVILNQILEHAKEIFWILGESSHVLRIGGSLIIGVPNLAAWQNRVVLLLGRQPRSIRPHPAHLRGFTKPDMLRLKNECFPGGYTLEGFGGAISIRFREFSRGCLPVSFQRWRLEFSLAP